MKIHYLEIVALDVDAVCAAYESATTSDSAPPSIVRSEFKSEVHHLAAA